VELTKIPFPAISNYAGSLTFLEAEGHIPFPIKRVYYIYDVPGNERRGFHAHKQLQQVLICIHGSCKLLLDDGLDQETITLDNPAEGLLINRTIWREMFDFSPGAVLMVLASEHYTESDYIRNYDEFLKYLEENRK